MYWGEGAHVLGEELMCWGEELMRWGGGAHVLGEGGTQLLYAIVQMRLQVWSYITTGIEV